MRGVVVLIPAYRPDKTLLEVTAGLAALGFEHLVVVDDGSGPECAALFAALEQRCTVLRHAVNCGKGRALKTGFNHIALHCPEAVGVVTVDADGQHHPEDVARVARRLLELSKPALVLGQRSFPRDVPLRSRVGNLVTRRVFRFLAGVDLEDTQTGLRGVPRVLLPELLRLSGENYEYEMNMLLRNKAEGREFATVPIRTIYAPGNPTSHFNPFFDSLKIYFVLLRFISSSLTAGLIDLVVYSICILSGASIVWSLFTARAVSSFINFLMNKNYVFLRRNGFWGCLFRYYALVLLVFLLSYVMVTTLHELLGMNPIPAKVLSETVLFVVSFGVQRALVFTRE